MKNFVYILRSELDPERYCTGMTNDFPRRLSEHNQGVTPHTKKFMPWKPVVVVEFDEREKAVAFEKYLKSGSGRAFSKKHF
jgi:putative endonuclease